MTATDVRVIRDTTGRVWNCREVRGADGGVTLDCRDSVTHTPLAVTVPVGWRAMPDSRIAEMIRGALAQANKQP